MIKVIDLIKKKGSTKCLEAVFIELDIFEYGKNFFYFQYFY